MMYTLFQVEKRKNITSTMKFSNMSSRERRTWFVSATTKIKSYANRSFREIAAEIAEKVPSMNYERLRSIRAKPKQKTKITTPSLAECQAVIELYAEQVPEILSAEEKTFKEQMEAAEKKAADVHRRLSETIHRLKELEKKNKKLEAKNESIQNELEKEKEEREKAEAELNATKDELLDLLRQQTKN